jgi:hypothetical protein
MEDTTWGNLREDGRLILTVPSLKFEDKYVKQKFVYRSELDCMSVFF